MTMTEFLKNKIKDFIESKKVWCDAEQTDDFMNEIYDSLNNLNLQISSEEFNTLEDAAMYSECDCIGEIEMVLEDEYNTSVFDLYSEVLENISDIFKYKYVCRHFEGADIFYGNTKQDIINYVRDNVVTIEDDDFTTLTVKEISDNIELTA